MYAQHQQNTYLRHKQNFFPPFTPHFLTGLTKQYLPITPFPPSLPPVCPYKAIPRPTVVGQNCKFSVMSRLHWEANGSMGRHAKMIA